MSETSYEGQIEKRADGFWLTLTTSVRMPNGHVQTHTTNPVKLKATTPESAEYEVAKQVRALVGVYETEVGE